jgi:hypothetical protein
MFFSPDSATAQTDGPAIQNGWLLPSAETGTNKSESRGS